ncbi:MAG: M48 family metalloprotease [Alphaproteobacteria bacterium]|nr:M48 family metalloprotease [Alphaproteobacteria bacterium]
MSIVRVRSFFFVLKAAVFLASLVLPAGASAQGFSQPSFIRDAEIENYLFDLAAPIYRAARIDPRSISISIVQSSVANAFVAEGMNEFFYTGLLQLTDTPEQLAGVIAHETGHISGGHLIRGKEEMRNASAEALLGTLLAVAAGVASGSSDVAAASAAGGMQIAERGFLRFSRAQEASADVAAGRFLDEAGISSRGMVEFFRKLEGQEMLPEDRQEEYVRTHPLTQDRVDALKRHLETSRAKDAKLPEKFYVMHERMKAKLMGFLQPETALLRYTDNDKRLSARYARAIALYRTGKVDRALALTDALIAQEPSNPFFYELKAQVQFENGRIEEAIANYRKAVELLPDSALLHQAYGHALLEGANGSKNSVRIDLAIQNLIEANRLEPRVPMTWRFLASAWGRKAELSKDGRYAAMATYALAEEAVSSGNDKAAGQLADRAMKGLPKGSTYWLRAQDIKLSTVPEGEGRDSKK